tara:strand:+ start:1844 stop:3106 length:1263 start_codon:yes stop_codon:yes gene_type:complete
MHDDELKASLAHLGNDLTSSLRISPENPAHAGWGQFLNAEGHKEQIGPYGTCAALLYRQIAVENSDIDQRVIAQLKQFWEDDGHNEKLKLQNVRVAFLVLSLAKIDDEGLQGLKEEAVTALLSRQLEDGSWSDWHNDGGQDRGPSRPEMTAWALLALHRNQTSNEAVEKAQSYLLNLVKSGRSVTLSNFAKSVLLFTLPRKAKLKSLVADARNYVSSFDDQNTETISFFDYLKPGEEGQTSVKRDYLCYPTLLIYGLMIAGLSKHGAALSIIQNASRREALALQLSHALRNDSFFKLPGAKFAATVDQAAIALSFEGLLECRTKFDRLGNFLVPILGRLRNGWWISTILPASLVLFALWILNTPSFATSLASVNWVVSLGADQWIKDNDSLVRLIASVVPFVFAYLPSYVSSRIMRLFQS